MSLWQRIGAEHLLGVAALAAAPVSIYAPAGITAVFSIAGIAALLLLWRDRQLDVFWRTPFAAVLGALLVWGGLSAFWTIHVLDTLTLLRGLTLLFVFTLALVASRPRDASAARTLCWLVAAALAVGLVLLALEMSSGAALSRLIHVWRHGTEVVSGGVVDRATVLLLVTGFALAIGLARQGWLLAGFGAMLPALLLSMVGNSHSARIAGALGLAVFIAVWFAGRWLVRLLGAAAASFVLIVPMLPFGPLSPLLWKPLLTDVKYSALHRLYIWEFAAQRIADRPLTGWGLNSARSIPGGDQEAPGGGVLLGLHPHNGSLQVWLELGLPGALLFAVLLWLLFAAIARLEDRFARAAAAGLVMAALAIACLSFGIWQTWWVSTLGLVAALATAFSAAPARSAAPAGGPAP